MGKFYKLILPLIGCAIMTVMSGSAYGIGLLAGIVDDQGRHWGDPFSSDIVNKSRSDQEAFIVTPYTKASIDDFFDAADYFGNNNSITTEQEAVDFAIILGLDAATLKVARFLEPPALSAATLLSTPFQSVILFCDIDATFNCGFYTSDDPSFGIGYAFYETIRTSSPSALLLFGVGLAACCSAYQRKKK